MRRLLILRHAKTERANADGDHARILMPVGRDDAARMGAYLLSEGFVPQLALVSDAARAQETFSHLCRGLEKMPLFETTGALYLASPPAILDAVRNSSDNVETLLVVGHNPGLHQLAFDLGQHGAPKLVAGLAAKFPTCALAILESDAAGWRDLQPANTRLVRFMTAKVLRAHDSVEPDPDPGDDR